MLVAGNTGLLNRQEMNAIATLMQRGHSMRQAKRILGITKKQPKIKWAHNKSLSS